MDMLYIVAYVANKTGWYAISTDYEYLKRAWITNYIAGDKYIQQLTSKAITLTESEG